MPRIGHPKPNGPLKPPGLTAFIDDVAVVMKDGDGELVLSQVFPDIGPGLHSAVPH
jgi:hypothetical protein